MKNTKRILSLVAAVAMTMQTGMAFPAYAEEEAESAQKIGLIYENDGTSGWNTGVDFVNNTTQKATFTYETDETNNRTYLHFTPSGKNTENYLAAPMIYASLGDDKIQFKKGYTIVTEMLVRTNTVDTLNTGRARINYSFPETSSLSTFTYINEGTTSGQMQTKYTPGMCSEVLTEFLTYNSNGAQVKDIRFGLGTYPTGDYKNEDLSKNNWYKILIKIDGEHNAEYTLFDEQGTKLTEKSGERLIKPESGYFENIALTTWMNAEVAEDATYTDVDYVKVYNVPDAAADNYTYFTAAQEETVVSNVKVDGVAIADVFEATNGTVTFDSNKTIDNAEVYYEINGEKTTLNQGADFTLSDNTLSFANGLVKNAAYTVNLDLGYAKYPITFDSVYEQKVGLIYSQEAETAHDEMNPAWTNNQYFTRETTGTGMKYTSVDNNFGEEKIGRVEIPLGDKKIKFKSGQTIVIESQLKIDKGTGTARVGLYYNTESTVKDPDTTKDELKNIERVSTFSSNHSFIAGLFDTSEYSDKMQVIYPNGVPEYKGTGDDNRHQTNIQWPGDKNQDYVTGYSLDGETAYKMVVWLNVLENKLTYALYCGETKIREYTTNDLGWVTTSDFLTSLRFANMANPAKSIELDYVKIYNIPKESAANYSNFTEAFDEWTITDKAVHLEDKTVTFGGVPENATVTVTSVDAQKVSDTSAAVENFTKSYQNGTTTITFDELPKNKVYTVNVTYGYSRGFEFETVYDGKTGVIKKADTMSDFENLWTSYGTMSDVTDDDGTTWTRLTSIAKRTDYALPSVSISLGDERIKAESDKFIRVKVRVRAKAKENSASNAGYSRVNMYANLSESLSDKKVTYTNGTTSVERNFLFGHNHALLWVLQGYNNQKGKHGYVNDNYPDESGTPNQSKQQFATETNLPVFDGTNVITVTTDLDMLENKARFIYEYDGKVFVEESTNLGFTAFDGWLNNIVIGNFGALNDCDYFDVDYVEISNIKKSDRSLTVNVADGKVTLTTARTDAELSDVGAMLYAASYDSTGALTGVKSVAAANGKKIEITGDSIRTFLWNKDMQPIE